MFDTYQLSTFRNYYQKAGLPNAYVRELHLRQQLLKVFWQFKILPGQEIIYNHYLYCRSGDTTILPVSYLIIYHRPHHRMAHKSLEDAIKPFWWCHLPKHGHRLDACPRHYKRNLLKKRTYPYQPTCFDDYAIVKLRQDCINWTSLSYDLRHELKYKDACLVRIQLYYWETFGMEGSKWEIVIQETEERNGGQITAPLMSILKKRRVNITILPPALNGLENTNRYMQDFWDIAA